MTVLIFPFNTSGFSAAFGVANQGADVIGIEPTYWTGAMWMTGLEQSDREGTFETDPGTAIRQGWLKEMCETNAVKNGSTTAGAQNVFPDWKTQTDTHYEKLAKYAVRKPATATTKAQGKITLVKEHQLFDVVRSVAYPYPIIAAKFYDSSTSERRVVTFSCSNAIDATDEGDIAVRVCTTRIGRESTDATGHIAGQTKVVSTTAPCYDSRGERVDGLPPKANQRFGRADRRVMAFGMRVLVTQDAGRIQWDSFDIPGYDPRKYDTDLKKCVALNYKDIPGSISNSPMRPGQTYNEFDMNNGGGVRVGMNWPGRFLNWFKMTWQEREDFKDKYVLEKLGLFKAICSDPAWAAALPELVAATKSWGLIPGIFTFPKWTAAETVQLGTRKFVAPYIYEVTTIVGEDGITYNTYAGPDWLPNVRYKVGTKIRNGANRYEVVMEGTSAASGGPTGTGQNIPDGPFDPVDPVKNPNGTNRLIWKYVGVVNPTAPTAYRPAGDTTTVITGPTGNAASIPDGTRVAWKVHRPWFPGMSPWLYIREGRKIMGQAEQSFNLLCRPTKMVKEPLCAYGYPYFDVHWNNEMANDDGMVAFEGATLGLKDDQEPAVAFMQFGSIKPAYDECPNLLVVRALSGDRLGWVPCRIEFSYIKIAECAGIIAGIADQLGVYTGDLNYETHVRPALIAAGFSLSIPKAA